MALHSFKMFQSVTKHWTKIQVFFLKLGVEMSFCLVAVAAMIIYTGR